ncbi:hypothetical protein K4A83_00300 [Spirulina subsalsa FACHB-351]|uniref:Uncharacterized protein n=1 Tax=Spirulina subsalsa FACHB-351 TaxID=234711 RepID=A0ABT3L0T2_9CYAN|nr:hypothetical protein [Spirulina subsalsa]MCW6034719.1 hypothetical protein [Spirulina subsalsa FACHB-351]
METHLLQGLAPIRRQLKLIACLMLSVVFVWVAVLLNFLPNHSVTTFEELPFVVSVEPS